MTDPTTNDTTPSGGTYMDPTLGTAEPDQDRSLGGNGEPRNDLFAPQNGETSTAGLNAGSAEVTSTGVGTFDEPGSGLGATLGSMSGLGSDEGSRTTAGTGGVSSLGSDPSDAGVRTGQMPASTVGGQSLLMENDNATSNSNVGGAQMGTVGNADDATGNPGANI